MRGLSYRCGNLSGGMAIVLPADQAEPRRGVTETIGCGVYRDQAFPGIHKVDERLFLSRRERSVIAVDHQHVILSQVRRVQIAWLRSVGKVEPLLCQGGYKQGR